MNDFDAFAQAVEAGVLRYDPNGKITAADSTVESQTSYAQEELCGMDVRDVFGKDDLPLALSDSGREVSKIRTEVVTNHGATYPVEIRTTTLPETGELLLIVDDLREHIQRERYLRFARDVNELIIQTDDESTLLGEVVDLISERRFGCTSIALLDGRGKLQDIYGTMEGWAEMDWQTIYTPTYVTDVLAEGDIVIEDVTRGPHRHHTVPEADHGAIALALSHRGNQYGVLTMHLPGKGSDLTGQERDLLRQLSDNVSTGIYNLRTERKLRDSRKQLSVLDRVLRHNLRNDMAVITGCASTFKEQLSGEQQQQAELIIEKATALLEKADKEREIVELILEPPPVTEINIVEIAEECLTEVGQTHSHATFTTDLPERAEVVAIRETKQALTELLENAVVHNDQETPEIELSVRHGDGVIHVDVSDDGPGIPEAEREVLTTEQDIGPLTHGSGLGLWLVNWITELSGGEVQFRQRDSSGSVVTVSLPAAETAAPEQG